MRPGEIIAGRYEILRSVRSGGLSVVFQATDRRTSKKVAVKIINIQPTEDALLKRIDREIKILSSLSHPHVVACLGAGSLADGRPYLILEWLEGEDLSDFKQRAPMTLRRVLEVAGQVSDALSAAHTLGIIHRDVKPANIFLVTPEVNARPNCRVLDFGVAKMPQANAAITRAGAILGTPSYMAPEQASYAMDVDARADVFSLGVVTFELLTGRLPWESTTDLARLARILIEPAIKVRVVAPDIPPQVAELVDSMLQLRQQDRIASTRAVHEKVLAALREIPSALLDETFTQDKELLSAFVSEDTADFPIVDPTKDPALRITEDSEPVDMKTEGLALHPQAKAQILDVQQKVDVLDVPPGSEMIDTVPPARDPSRAKNRRKSRSRSVATETLPKQTFPKKENSQPTQVVSGVAELRSASTRIAGPRVLNTAESPKPRVASVPLLPEDHEITAEPTQPPLDAKPTLEAQKRAKITGEISKLGSAIPVAPERPRPPSLKKPIDDRLSYLESMEPVLFGRVQEIDALKQSVLRPLNTERPSYTLVVGPAGIGKTRVRAELTKLVRQVVKPPVVFAGRAEESTRSSPFAFLRRMFFQEVGINSDDPPAQKRLKLLEMIPPGPEIRRMLVDAEPPIPGFESIEDGVPSDRTRFSTEEMWSERPSMVSAIRDAFGVSAADNSIERDEERATLAAFLCRALGIEYPEIPPIAAAKNDPRLMGDQVSRAVDIALRFHSRRRGLVVIVDDAHFLDHLSGQVLRGLLKPARNLRVVLVAFTLPNVLDGEKSALGSQDAKTIELEPLDARASREFARSLVRGSVESSSLENLVKRAAGNPLYLEQLVRAVQANGTLELSEGGELELVGLKGDRTDDDRVPPTVAAAVVARVSHLKHDLQKVLTTAAVFGEVFWVEGVAKLLGEGLEETTILLDNLVLENLVRRRASARYRGQMEMEFTHAVIRSVALSRLKRKRRHKLERLAVEYLESVGESDESMLAQHVAHMGKLETAAELYANASDGSLALGSLVSASALADEGLLLTEGGGTEARTRKRLLDLAERIAVLSRDYEGALGALEAMNELAESAADRAQIVERRARVAYSAQRYKEAEDEAERAIALWKEAKSDEGEASAKVAHAEACEALGDGRSALRGYITAQAVFAEKGAAGGLARTTRGLARIAVSSGDYRTAENRFRESLVHAQSTRDRLGSLYASVGLAEVARLLGHAAKAGELLDDAVRSATSIEHHLLVEAERAKVAAEDDRSDDAKKLIDRALRAVENRRELESARRYLVLVHAQISIGSPAKMQPAPESVTKLRAELERALDGAKQKEPRLVVAIEVQLALAFAIEGRMTEAKTYDAAAIAQFVAEGAVVAEEPPGIFFAHARVLELAKERRDETRAAFKKAVEHLDSIASRLDRKMRKQYFERPIARAIVAKAEEHGLKLERDATSNRITVVS